MAAQADPDRRAGRLIEVPIHLRSFEELQAEVTRLTQEAAHHADCIKRLADNVAAGEAEIDRLTQEAATLRQEHERLKALLKVEARARREVVGKGKPPGRSHAR